MHGLDDQDSEFAATVLRVRVLAKAPSMSTVDNTVRKRRASERKVVPMIATHRTPATARISTDEEEVRMGLLSNRASNHGDGYANGLSLGNESEDSLEDKKSTSPLTKKDKRAIVLLIVLYLIQGIPVGLAFGSIPFILKSKLSYSDLGTFSLATFPYSLKLLHAPIVDSIFNAKLGRRKSWIIPIQMIMGTLMIWLGNNAASIIEVDLPNVVQITTIFTSLVFFAATQDIAVDGWALTLLSKENLSYASTAQTAGLNTGYFLSFTVFLALNSADLANKYFRSTPSPIPFLSLGGYLRFWGVASYLVTLWLLFFEREDPVAGDGDDLHLGKVYKSMWSVCKLKHVQLLCLVHMVSKIGFQANDAVTGLKMVEKGLNKEDLALISLIDFPFEIIGGWLAARWSTGDKVLRPWLTALWIRLGFSVFFMLVVKVFPLPPVPISFFLMLVVTNILATLTSTVQFVGMSAFHTQVSDPFIGGTYMTLLNTISNLGGTWPRFFVLRAVDYFTIATCNLESSSEKNPLAPNAECVSDVGKTACKAAGGTCIIERDGYYITSMGCVTIGVILLFTFIGPAAKRLQSLPLSKWRISEKP